MSVVIEYILCYSTAYFLGFGTAVLIWMYQAIKEKTNGNK